MKTQNQVRITNKNERSTEQNVCHIGDYMAGLGFVAIAQVQNVNNTTVWRRRKSIRKKYLRYSAELSQKIWRGQNESRSKGNFAGGKVPYGYTTANKKIIVHEERAEIVRWMYQSYSTGKIVREIIEELTARGVTHMGKPFKANTINKILRLEKYIGIYRHGDEVFTNIYPQIVSTELFNRVQTLLAKNKIGSSSREVVFLLKKKVICGICGRPINGESGTARDGTMRYYYKCSNRKKHHSCPKESVKKADLEELVLNTTLLLLNKPENLSVIADEVIAIHQKRAREQAVLTLLRDQRSKAQKALDNLMKALEAGIFTATTKDRITELESEIDELNGRILTEECKEANLLTEEEVETFLLGRRVAVTDRHIIYAADITASRGA